MGVEPRKGCGTQKKIYNLVSNQEFCHEPIKRKKQELLVDVRSAETLNPMSAHQ